MSNSSMISYTNLSPNNSGTRTRSIDRLTLHCVVGQCSIESLGALFADPARQASSNYGIGADGRIGLFVPEDKRSWCSSSEANDQRAITIECASDTKSPYAMTDRVYAAIIALCTDICKRNGKTVLTYIPDKAKALAYVPKSNEMLITLHKWFAATECPGQWLIQQLPIIAQTVTSALSPKTVYRVQVGAFTNKAYADAYLDKIKKAGFPDAYITTK